MSDGAFYELQNETIGVFLEVSGVDDGGGDVMGLAIVDGEKRLIDRVIRSERPEDPVDEVADDSGERQRGAELYRDYAVPNFIGTIRMARSRLCRPTRPKNSCRT